MTFDDRVFPDLVNNYNEYWDSGVVPEDLATAKIIENWFDSGSTLLDVGIGTGAVAEYLKNKKDLKISGLDISESASKLATKRGIDFQVRDINNELGLKENELYDYILLKEVIEHTVYPQKILIDAVTHARKGVIVTIPNSAYITFRIHMLRGYAPRQSFTHLHFWSIKDFRVFCEGLEIKPLEFKTFLSNRLLTLRNLLAYQQIWLLASKISQK